MPRTRRGTSYNRTASSDASDSEATVYTVPPTPVNSPTLETRTLFSPSSLGAALAGIPVDRVINSPNVCPTSPCHPSSPAPPKAQRKRKHPTTLSKPNKKIDVSRVVEANKHGAVRKQMNTGEQDNDRSTLEFTSATAAEEHGHGHTEEVRLTETPTQDMAPTTTPDRPSWALLEGSQRRTIPSFFQTVLVEPALLTRVAVGDAAGLEAVGDLSNTSGSMPSRPGEFPTSNNNSCIHLLRVEKSATSSSSTYSRRSKHVEVPPTHMSHPLPPHRSWTMTETLLPPSSWTITEAPPLPPSRTTTETLPPPPSWTTTEAPILPKRTSSPTPSQRFHCKEVLMPRTTLKFLLPRPPPPSYSTASSRISGHRQAPKDTNSGPWSSRVQL